jgi:cell division protein FtsI/penicillin-binding protein 2
MAHAAQAPKSKQKSVVVWRVRLLQLLFTTILGLIFAKTLFLQTMKASSLKRTSDSQKRRSTPTTIFRGEIADRNGVVLAIDTARFDLFMRPSSYKASIGQTADLAKLLKQEAEIIEEFAKSKKIVKLGSSFSRSKADAIAKLKISGLDLIPVNQRDYPQGKLAAHLLGFVSWDASGKAGIEESLNQTLRSAQNKADTIVTRGDGLPISHLASLKPIINSSFGQQVELTIDSKVQYKVEEILDKGLEKYKADRATALVMIPSSGEIIAWANSPSYDPNFYGKYKPDLTVNWAISQVYEPGSTFKILTVAAGLTERVIKPEYRYLDEGKLKIGNRTIRNHDYKPGREKEIGLMELFRFSSNTAAASIGLKMPPERFYTQLRKFGIASKTGIEIPGESSGALKKPEEWKEIDVATTSFGQGAVAVTPIQLAAAINTIANRGEWVQPHLIKSVRSADGHKLISKMAPVKRRVVTARIAKQVSDLLAESIKANLEEDESYIAGDIPNVAVAGKTGTAQKYCPELGTYCPGKTIASFIGYFPAEAPQFLVIVVFDSPAGAGGWGNTVAGPVFNQIGEELIKIYPNGFLPQKRFALF